MPPDEESLVKRLIEKAKKKDEIRKIAIPEGLTPEEKRLEIIKRAKDDISSDIGASGIVSEGTAKEVAGKIVDNYVSKLYKGKDIVLELQKEGKEDTKTGYYSMNLANKIRNHVSQQGYNVAQETEKFLMRLGVPVARAGDKVFRDAKIVVSSIPVIKEFYPQGVDLVIQDAEKNIKKYKQQETTTKYPTK